MVEVGQPSKIYNTGFFFSKFVFFKNKTLCIQLFFQ